MSHLVAEMLERAEKHGPIIVGVAGAGQMGTDLVVQIALMQGIRIGALVARHVENARAAAIYGGHAPEDVVEATTPAAVDRAIEMGKLAICADFRIMNAAGRVDVVVDATGNPNTGTALALDAIAGGKHIVMLNVEADITVGRHLAAEAKKAGVVYTGAAGDEPASTLELIAFAKTLGMDVIAAGKGKNNPLKFDAVPADYEDEAAARNMNPRMLVEFVDGSKTMVEMVAIANATGLVPDVPGMHGPSASAEELAHVLIPKADGGILDRKGVVDYSIGPGVAPGVFIVVEPKHPRVIERMADLKVGKGPYFALLRPFHLTSLEVPLSVARAVLHRRPDMEPVDYPVAEATAIAKRDLAPGTVLGRIGEDAYRGFAMTWSDARRAGALPLGLAEKAKVLKPIRKGEQLTYDNCAPDETLVVTQIRRRLDLADARFVSVAAA